MPKRLTSACHFRTATALPVRTVTVGRAVSLAVSTLVVLSTVANASVANAFLSGPAIVDSGPVDGPGIHGKPVAEPSSSRSRAVSRPIADDTPGVEATDATALSRAAAFLPSLTAVHVRRHEPSEIELARARVELSPLGLRVRLDGGGGPLEIVQDFVGERLWFIDLDRSVAHRLAFANADEASVPSPVEDSVIASGIGFLGSEACGGGASRDDGEGHWRGRAVDAWLCLDASGETTAIELIDRVHGIVVFRRTPEGIVDELRDIRPMRFATDHFSPPSRFRAIDERELFHGAPAIGQFHEREDGAS